MTKRFILIIGLLAFVAAAYADDKYESYETGQDGQSTTYSTDWHAQTFECATAHTVTYVELYVTKTGSPGNITVALRATDGEDKPTGANLASVTVADSAIPGSLDWTTFTFASSYAISANTKYAIVVSAPSGSASNYFHWGRDGSSPAYANGQGFGSSDSGSSWSPWTVDFLFREYGTVSSSAAPILNQRRQKGKQQ